MTISWKKLTRVIVLMIQGELCDKVAVSKLTDCMSTRTIQRGKTFLHIYIQSELPQFLHISHCGHMHGLGAQISRGKPYKIYPFLPFSIQFCKQLALELPQNRWSMWQMLQCHCGQYAVCMCPLTSKVVLIKDPKIEIMLFIYSM